MLALGIALVILGFVLLPRGGIRGPAGPRHVDVDLQGVQPAGGSPRRRPEWAGAVMRGLLAFVVVAAGMGLIGIGS
jgi:hypothetical protein